MVLGSGFWVQVLGLGDGLAEPGTLRTFRTREPENLLNPSYARRQNSGTKPDTNVPVQRTSERMMCGSLGVGSGHIPEMA